MRRFAAVRLKSAVPAGDGGQVIEDHQQLVIHSEDATRLSAVQTTVGEQIMDPGFSNQPQLLHRRLAPGHRPSVRLLAGSDVIGHWLGGPPEVRAARAGRIGGPQVLQLCPSTVEAHSHVVVNALD